MHTVCSAQLHMHHTSHMANICIELGKPYTELVVIGHAGCGSSSPMQGSTQSLHPMHDVTVHTLSAWISLGAVHNLSPQNASNAVLWVASGLPDSTPHCHLSLKPKLWATRATRAARAATAASLCTKPRRPPIYFLPPDTVMRLGSGLGAGSVFGTVTVSTPLSRLALMLSSLMLSGRVKERLN